MQIKFLIFILCVIPALSSPYSELDAKLRRLIAREKGMSLTGRVVSKEKGLSLKGRGVMAPKRSTGSSVTESEKNELLQLHNDARNNVKPPAKNMPQLTWNNELATVAQNYADQCIWGHNPDRSGQSSSFSYVGENLYVTTVSSGYLEASVKEWDDEKNDYDFSSNTCSGVCGHYTQVVWADTTLVGCGVKTCPSMTNLPASFANAKYIVCNYAPGGNYIGQKPYVEGTGSEGPSPTGSNTPNGCK